MKIENLKQINKIVKEIENLKESIRNLQSTDYEVVYFKDKYNLYVYCKIDVEEFKQLAIIKIELRIKELEQELKDLSVEL